MYSVYRHIQKRRQIIFLAVVALSALVTCPSPAKACEVILLKSAELKPYEDVIRGFRDVCQCNVSELKLRPEDGREKILQRSPDAVVAVGTAMFRRAKMIKDRPVVYVMAMPSETASPNSNISGIRMDIAPEDYVSAMREMLPAAKRIGLIYDKQYTDAFVKEAIKAARGAGIELADIPVKDRRDIPGQLENLFGRVDIFWMLPDPGVITDENVDYMLHLSFQHRVPIFSFSRKYVEMGAVASLDVDPYDMGSQAAEMVRVLIGGQAGARRVYPRTSHLTINRNVASKMGIKINDAIARRGKNID